MNFIGETLKSDRLKADALDAFPIDPFLGFEKQVSVRFLAKQSLKLESSLDGNKVSWWPVVSEKT